MDVVRAKLPDLSQPVSTEPAAVGQLREAGLPDQDLFDAM
jgi:hypothetical protein